MRESCLAFQRSPKPIDEISFLVSLILEKKVRLSLILSKFENCDDTHDLNIVLALGRRYEVDFGKNIIYLKLRIIRTYYRKANKAYLILIEEACLSQKLSETTKHDFKGQFDFKVYKVRLQICGLGIFGSRFTKVSLCASSTDRAVLH